MCEPNPVHAAGSEEGADVSVTGMVLRRGKSNIPLTLLPN